jgi:RND family efflux transporter MFP subunit
MRILALLLLSSIVATIGCGGTHAPSGAPKLPEVYVTTPITSDVTDTEIFTGRTESPESVDIRARVTGYLKWAVPPAELAAKEGCKIREGGDVKKGDLIAEIDPLSYRAQYEQAEAALVQAIAHRDRLAQDYRRDSALRAKGSLAISESDYDMTVGNYKEAEAAVKSAQATRDLNKVNLDYCKIWAPFDGVVSRRAIDPGNVVQANTTMITSIVRTDKMYVYFDVDERTMLRLRRLKKEGKLGTSLESYVTVKMGLADEMDDDGRARFPHEGSIDFEDNRVDSLTGTLRMRGVFLNPDRLLSPGLFSRVQLPVSPTHKAILIPEAALSTDQGEKFLYVITRTADKDDPARMVDVVEYRKVKIGALHNGYRVITEGLKGDERVIVSGLQRARRGIQVNAKPATKDQLPSSHAASNSSAPPVVIKPMPPRDGKPVQQPSSAGGR